MVEPSPSLPRDKAFSIAAALPMPCYSSLLDDLSNICVHSEERLPFSQSDYSAQHLAQQLTLLEQVSLLLCLTRTTWCGVLYHFLFIFIRHLGPFV